MFKSRQYKKCVVYYRFRRAEFVKYVAKVEWNEEAAKKVILEKAGIIYDNLKTEASNYSYKAYFNCSIHYRAKYYTEISRTIYSENNFGGLNVMMKLNAVPCECLRKLEVIRRHPTGQTSSEFDQHCIDLTEDCEEIDDDLQIANSSGTNIQILPAFLLERIFLDIPNKKDLRLVSKAFKNVVDNSSQLMKDQWLIIQNTLDINPRTISHAYQKLEIHFMGARELNWMSKYQRKDRIKAIKITSGDRCPIFMQYIISNFESLELIDLDLDHSYDEKFRMQNQMRLIPNEHSKLETLHIGYYENKQFNVLEMFADIPSIKRLYIYEFDILKFPQNVKWKLEKLAVPDMLPLEYEVKISEDNCKQFCISQQMSLKDIRFHDIFNYTCFFMRNLPYLERLTLSMESVENGLDINAFNNNHAISIISLKHFTFKNLYSEHYPAFEIILKFYKGIKYLCLTSYSPFSSDQTLMQIADIKLINLTHLLLKTDSTFHILNARMPKLNYLGLTNVFCNDEDERFNLSLVPEENLKYVKKASLKLPKVADILALIWKCPNLCHLNLDVEEWRFEKGSFILQIKSIIAAVPKIKQLGVCQWFLKMQQITLEKLQKEIVNKNVILKVHDDFTSMLAEDWDEEFPDNMNRWIFELNT